jgi:two-component system, OmpR family, KDP operon response regulator KdpE
LSNNKHNPLAKRPEILLIEDDPQIRRIVKAILTAENYRFYEAAAAEDGIAQAGARNPDLVLLDLGLPDKDGIDVIREIRQWSHIPIVVLSAWGQERDKIIALDAGADDYVGKPFGPGELSARIRANLRRVAILSLNEPSETVAFGNVSINLTARRVLVGGSEVHLTPNQYKLLQVLLHHAGKVVTQRQLLKQVWGPEHLDEPQYLRVYMGQLRQKLEADPAHPKHLITELGVGYRLRFE